MTNQAQMSKPTIKTQMIIVIIYIVTQQIQFDLVGNPTLSPNP
jgi:hypothetical protein